MLLSLVFQQWETQEKGASRLLRILISESAHLIWVLRCDTTINGTNHTERAIKNRWMSKINQRLQLDRMIGRKLIRTKDNYRYMVRSDNN
ncbi:hypothetical protein C8R48DRAFT_811459 [Suillus tomentosus]|nr:hypothetical protein C8R48DRAFT_811459 [Suillus tomentosus]